MNLLQAELLTKSFGNNNLFENISFTINDNERVALIAQNGTGKTTLLRILAGKEYADSGNIITKKDLRIGYLEQQPAYPEDLTVIEACLQSDNKIVNTIEKYELALLKSDTEELSAIMSQMDVLKAWDYEVRVKQILSQLKITDFQQKISDLSGGQLKRVALANVLISEPEILLLDEPTNHLDLDMIEWLEDYLKRSSMATLMITHDRYFLDNVCNNILEIDNKTLYSYSGNYSYYLSKKQERIENFQAETESMRNVYRRELEWMRSTPQARTGKSKGRIDRFEEIENRAKQRIEDKNIQLNVKASYIGNKIFEAVDVSKSYDDLTILDKFNYTFSRYEKMGIIGKNGTGKSTFLKLLLGETAPDFGHFDVGETVKFGYYSQTGLEFDENQKVIEAVTNIAETIDLGNGKSLTAMQLLQHFLFSPATQHNYISKLSGGERKRLYLCTVLMGNPNFLILDEPTNDLDIVTLNILEEYLKNFKGCVIVVSHDRFFMDKVVDHLLVFEGNGIIKDFPGNYTQYREYIVAREKKEQQEKKHQEESKRRDESTAQNKQKSDKPRKLSYKEKREFEELEIELEKLNQEKSSIELKLSSGEISDNQTITELSEQFAKLKDLIDEKEMRWLELSEI